MIGRLDICPLIETTVMTTSNVVTCRVKNGMLIAARPYATHDRASRNVRVKRIVASQNPLDPLVA